ncbi:MAG: 2-oxoglutarate ferredoxin oxidoreductase subunit beta [Oceanicoccus sp.]|jgi:2-oxoglutarate ferredoxin oxidoreductase subunit beta
MSLPLLNNLVKYKDRITELETDNVITWCSGCGNFGILNAVMHALAIEEIGVKDAVLCYDVGCNGNASHNINAYTIHGLHGRVLSLAAGAKIANPDKKVIAFAGDGATFSEGVNHLVHSVRNNFPFVFVFHNNENYGLTTGQPSATTPRGAKMNSAPEGVTAQTINPLQFVLSLKPSFVARTYSGDIEHMTATIQEGMKHDGFAFIEVLQSCPTYNKETPDEWYAKNMKKIETVKDYDPTDIWAARRIVEDVDNIFHIGLLYKNEKAVDFMSLQPHREGRKPIVDEVEHVSVKGMY